MKETKFSKMTVKQLKKIATNCTNRFEAKYVSDCYEIKTVKTEASFAKMTIKQLKKIATNSFNAIYVADCYRASDMRNFNFSTNELEQRGYDIQYIKGISNRVISFGIRRTQ